MSSSPSRWVRIGGLALAATVAAIATLSWLRQPVATPAQRGADVAERLGCFTCHGPGGVGGVPNPGSVDDEVPGWTGGTAMMYLESVEEIREWVLYGKPRRLEGEEDQDPDALVRMPAYEGHLSDAELDDSVAYFRAVAAFDPGVPEAAGEGWMVAAEAGCYGCHGPGGRVAMANPGSFKRVIPAWDGDDFAELVRDDTELEAWIRDGQIPRLQEHPVARRFIDQQVIQMPAYGDVLSDEEIAKIVTYIRWLRAADAAEPAP